MNRASELQTDTVENTPFCVEARGSLRDSVGAMLPINDLLTICNQSLATPAYASLVELVCGSLLRTRRHSPPLRPRPPRSRCPPPRSPFPAPPGPREPRRTHPPPCPRPRTSARTRASPC